MMQRKLELVHDIRQPTSEKQKASRTIAARAAWLGSAVEETERLEVNAARALLADAFANTRVLLVGFEHEHICEMRQKLRYIGASAIASASSVRQLEDAADMRLGFTHIMVNFDAFGDVEVGVDALLSFRSRAPSKIVVACSEKVGGDDFGTERLRICDATLKLPISAPRLADGLLAAFLNHSEGLEQLS